MGLVSRLPPVVGGTVLIVLPPLLGISLQTLMTKVLIFAIFALSLNLISGYAGLWSLGHAAYFAVGGYATGILMLRYGIESFWLVAPAAILMATIAATIFGIISLRVSGIYFLLVTLALGELVFSVAWKWDKLTGGYDGLSGIPLPNLGIHWFIWSTLSLYYFVLAFFLISFFILYRIVNSPFGVALQGIRESETRMRSLGYNTWAYKYIAFVVAGLFAGMAGVLFAHFNSIIVPSHAALITSAAAMVMGMLGSDRVFFGPVVGAALVILLEYFLSLYAPARWPLILGGVFIATIMFLRGGVSLYLVRLWEMIEYRHPASR